MCAVSMIGDFYGDKWKDSPYWPNFPSPSSPAVPPLPVYPPSTSPLTIQPQVSKADFDELKREVMDMKELLKRAIKYDQDNNEPECQIEEKMELLRKMAEMVGVSIDDVIGPAKKKVLLTE
jgi:hypothetical protein